MYSNKGAEGDILSRGLNRKRWAQSQLLQSVGDPHDVNCFGTPRKECCSSSGFERGECGWSVSKDRGIRIPSLGSGFSQAVEREDGEERQ